MTHSNVVTNMANKVAVVTGGSSGIGSAIVNRFVTNGSKVISIDLKKAEIEIGTVQHFDCDLTDESAVSQVFTEISKLHPQIDVLCANAGIVPAWSRIVDTNFSDWKKVIDINVNALFLTILHGAKLLKKGSGTVVVTGSINSIKGDPNIASYVASKHAALGIIKSAALDLGRDGIRVNGVAPGPIATKALISRIEKRLADNDGTLDDYLAKIANQTALGRIATEEEVINTIEFLALEVSSGITGQLISVDCGA
jgi:NAD(P)-dependent dehydrogenase (short-subunit alcohol dehydrogenase family)